MASLLADEGVRPAWVEAYLPGQAPSCSSAILRRVRAVLPHPLFAQHHQGESNCPSASYMSAAWWWESELRQRAFREPGCTPKNRNSTTRALRDRAWPTTPAHPPGPALRLRETASPATCNRPEEQFHAQQHGRRDPSTK